MEYTGAMVKVYCCANALTKAVKELGIKPNEILDQVAVIVMKIYLMQGDNVQDGMDLSFCTG